MSLLKMKDNLVIGNLSDFENSTLKFSGNGNILYIEDGVKLKDSSIVFNGDNSLLYLSYSNSPYIVKISANNSNVIFFGRSNYFNDQVNVVASEHANIFVGSDCLFSFGVMLRNADAHLIYNAKDNKRINNTKSIYIGDHVWVGQNVLILKGVLVGSGSVIGAGSIVSNKVILSNSIWAGNPAKKIKDNIYWSGECVHSWTKNSTSRFEIKDDNFLFEQDSDSIVFSEFENQLNFLNSAAECLDFIKVNFINKINRMFIK